ncbi:MAG TPA: DASS family sodium-coupled anion symporter [Thermoanaerobaculia bacterium]|nr:DASS family sodium-coupled anion symporter [Thermoanaerobaculia bacterium]
MSRRSSSTAARVGLALGPLAAITVYLLLAGSVSLAQPGRVVAAVGVLMAVLWLTEAIPIPATALLPIALIPLLTGGAVGIREVSEPYAHELIFLFMGGFMMALAMQRWGLHRRIALRIILAVGDRPSTVVLGFMLASAFLSMWISNTATVVMMLPIALSVVELVRDRLLAEKEKAGAAVLDSIEAGEFHFAIALLLGTAYAASIGGMATLIGTPPNLMMAAFVADDFGREITFAGWLPLGLPFVVVLLPVAWILLTRVVFPIRVREIPGGRRLIHDELARCGPISRQERLVLAVFLLAATTWVLRSWLTGIEMAGVTPLAGLSDTGIAIAAALLLFTIPADLGKGEFLLDWPQAVKLPWGILLLFGGGLSLAAAVRSSEVDRFVGDAIAGVANVPVWAMMALVAGVVILLTELTSNTATTATFLPIAAATAEGLGIDPLLLVIPAAMAASCAFMMPVATPPNAIVFGSGELTIPQMCRAGLWLNVISLVVILAIVWVLGGPVLGIGG